MKPFIHFSDFLRKSNPQSLAIVYHWDCDGLASAALIENYLERIGWRGTLHRLHPHINHYFLTDEELERLRTWHVGAMVSVDLNFSLSVIEQLEHCAKNVFVFDHHEQTATIHRPGQQDPRVPGCSMLLTEYLQQPLSLLSVLGMVGDQEDRLRLFPTFYEQTEAMIRHHHLDFKTLLRITKLFDTLSILGDEEGLEYGIALLRHDPCAALQDARLLENEKQLAKELDSWSNVPLQKQGNTMRMLSLRSPHYILSEVTRRLARKYPNHILLIDQNIGPLHNLYIRRRDIPVDLSNVASLARAQGYNAGGKKEVVGVLLPAEDFLAFRGRVMQLLTISCAKIFPK